jgi:hypothetical protein
MYRKSALTNETLLSSLVLGYQVKAPYLIKIEEKEKIRKYKKLAKEGLVKMERAIFYYVTLTDKGYEELKRMKDGKSNRFVTETKR